jgi:hypothetical protein
MFTLRVAVANCVLLSLVCSAPAYAQGGAKRVLIDGVPVECSAAAKYRDGALFAAYDALLASWDAERAKRYDVLIAELRKQLDQSKKEWDSASAATRKTAVLRAAILAVGIASKAAGEAALGTKSLSGVEKKAAELAADRGSQMIKTVAESAAGTAPDVAGIIKDYSLPLLATLTLTGGAAALVGGAFVAADVSELVMAVWEKWSEQQAAKASWQVVRTALDRVVTRSPADQLGMLRKIKNDIDRTCGGR